VTLPVIFHELAEGELNEAAAFYARARPGLGDAFVAEVQHTVDALAAAPLAGAAAVDDVRRWIVRRFPYSVCTEYARITFVFSRLRIRNVGPSTGAVAADGSGTTGLRSPVRAARAAALRVLI
jgi:hypothetical protein